MIPLFKKLIAALLYDDLAVRRWLRAAVMAMAGSGMMWGDQIAANLGTPAKWVKVCAVGCMIIAGIINLGEKNPKEVTDGTPPA